MKDILYLARIQIIIVVIFFIGRSIRPSILQSDGCDYLKLFLLSFPNFCEGILGVFILTGIGLYLNRRYTFTNQTVYSLATVFTSLYVITQEFKMHNLGGNNVYDPNDVIFSILGIVIGALYIFRKQPKFRSAI